MYNMNYPKIACYAKKYNELRKVTLQHFDLFEIVFKRRMFLEHILKYRFNTQMECPQMFQCLQYVCGSIKALATDISHAAITKLISL